jgi:hypothetical protein
VDVLERRIRGCTSAMRSITSRAAQAISRGLRSPSRASIRPAASPSTSASSPRHSTRELLERLQRIVVRDPSCRFDHLGQRPVGDAFAVRQGTSHEHASPAPHRRGTRVRVGLPDARLAVDGEYVGATVPKAAVERVLKEPSSDWRPTSGARGPSGRPGPSSRSITRQARRGIPRPFSSRGPASSTARLAAASRYAVGPTRISPGIAACWSRAARFTASPVANVDSASSMTSSPASIPMRA